MFNIVMLFLGLAELGLPVLCLILFVIGCVRRSKGMIIGSLVVPYP